MSPRVWRLMGEIVRFNMSMKQVTARQNVLADYSSRTTSLHRTTNVNDTPRFAKSHKHSSTKQTAEVNAMVGGVIVDPKLSHLIDVAEEDEGYQANVNSDVSKDKLASLQKDHPAHQVARKFNRLTLFQAKMEEYSKFTRDASSCPRRTGKRHSRPSTVTMWEPAPCRPLRP